MAEFMLERYLPGITHEAVAAAVARTRVAMEAMAAEGVTVRHLSCTLVPSDESVFCLFEGPSAHSVEEANRRAEFRFDRVVQAVSVS